MSEKYKTLEDLIKQDSLIQCFTTLAGLKDKPIDVLDIVPHLPASTQAITPYLLINAADRLGFKGQLHKKSLKQISLHSTPVILILKSGKACILLEKHNKSQTAIVKQLNGKVDNQEISYDELEKIYEGYAIAFKVKYDFSGWSDSKRLEKFKKSWFWGVLFEYKSFYYHMLLAALFVNLFALAMPLFIMNVYDRVIPNSAVVTLWTLAIGVFIVFTFDFLLKTLRALFVDVANKKIDIVLSTKLLYKALSIKIEHQAEAAGVRANHLRDFDTVRDFFSSVATTGLVDIPFTLIFLIVIGLIGGPLFLVPLLAGVIVLTSALLLSKSIYRYVMQTFVGSAQKTAILFESLSAVEAIKSTSAYQQVLGRWRSLTTKVSHASLHSKFYTVLASNITAFCSMMSSVIVVIWGVYLIKDGQLTTGGLIACVILTGRSLAPFAQATSLLTRFQQTKCSYEALDKLMKLPEDRPVEKVYLNLETLDGAIEFDKVNFRYPGATVDFLENISFKIKAREHVAILGNTGSGKTSLLKMMMGFYSPSAGEIRFDDMHQEQLDPELIRKHIGYLEQTPKLMYGNAASNIMMKAPWVGAEEVLAAAQISGADSFLRKHPDGYQMLVGENGKGLSGGQIQMIALARAILLNPSMLLFDEPTSHLDNATEATIVNNLKTFANDKTLIVSTHRKPILEIVSRIIVLNQGRIVMDGKKDDVLAELSGKKKKAKGASK